MFMFRPIRRAVLQVGDGDAAAITFVEESKSENSVRKRICRTVGSVTNSLAFQTQSLVSAHVF